MIIDESDQELLFAFIKGVTGNVHDVESRKEFFVRVAERLIKRGGYANLYSYLKHLSVDTVALDRFINATTNHTTRWFRENTHFKKLKNIALEYVGNTHGLDQGKSVFRVISIGCSSGHEVYSAALELEKIRRHHNHFNYQITGLDIDSECLAVARRAIYPMSGLRKIPAEFHSLILQGSAETEGLFTLDHEIRRRCHFRHGNLMESEGILGDDTFDAIFIRNVLFYFANETVSSIVDSIYAAIKDKGSLFVGHSEVFLLTGKKYTKSDVTGVFTKSTKPGLIPTLKRVLVIEDSGTVQAVLTSVLKRKGFCVDCVNNKYALEHYLATKPAPDIISLDLHMPGFDGEDWLRKFRTNNVQTPVVVISSLFAEDARPVVNMLSTGAQDYIEKSKLDTDSELVGSSFDALLKQKNSNSDTDILKDLINLDFSPELVLIGASTGGIKALRDTLRSLPSSSAPVLVVQHISPKFGRELANYLARVTGLKIGKTDRITRLENGHLYIATGDYHLAIKTRNKEHYVGPKQYPEGQFRPSVDVLFNSVDHSSASKSISILLTGMGKDGVEGMGKLKRNGGITIAQDYNSSAVHGMPGEAINAGYASYIAEPGKIREFLVRCITQRSEHAAHQTRKCS